MLRKLSALCALYLYPAMVMATFLPNPSYTSYNLEQGLSNSSVYSIGQDAKGYMWFGTEDGLNRFDGHEFKVYRYQSGNPHSIAGNAINQIYLAPDNSFWVATTNGVSLYHPQTDRFTSYNVANGLSDNDVRAVLKVDEQVYLGTSNGLNRLDLKTGEISVFPVSQDGRGTSHGQVRALSRQGNQIWVATWGGGVNRYDLTTQTFAYFSHDPATADSISADTVVATFVDDQNTLWAGAVNGGLNRFDPSCQCFERIEPIEGYEQTTIHGFSQGDDTLWMASSIGLSKYEQNSQQFAGYSLLKAHELGNITRDVRAVFVSRDGTIWVGSFQMGVTAIPENGFAFQTYQYSEQAANSLRSDDINSLYLEREHLWTGAVGGLYRYPISDNGALGDAVLVLDSFTLKIEPSKDGSYWLATNDGLYHLDAQLKTISHHPHTSLIADPTGQGAVLDVIESREGDLFVANWRGGLTQLVDEQQGIFRAVGTRGDPRGVRANANIYALVQGPRNHLWIGTQDGVNRYDIHNDVIAHYPLQLDESQPQVTVYYVFVDAADIYLGTSNGVYQYQAATDSFIHHPLALKSQYVQGIARAGDGSYWLSTFNGLYRWQKATQALTAFFHKDGLQGNEFNTKGVAVAPDGSLFFSGVDGVTTILPDKLAKPMGAGRLRWRDPRNHTLAEEQLMLRLSHENNQLMLNYFVDDYYLPQRHQFRYKINQGQWLSNGNATSLQLSGLASGRHRVQLQYKRAGIGWTPALSDVLIKISPPFYLSWLALLLYVLVTVLAGYLIYRARTKSIRRQQQKLRQRVAEQTAELSSLLSQKTQLFANISHELRTPITLINAPLEQLLQDNELNNQQKKLVTLAQNNGKRLFSLVERILNLTRAAEKTRQQSPIYMDDLLIRYETAFTPLLAQKNIRFDCTLASQALIHADKEDIASVIENLLSNALKYTKAGGWVNLDSRVENGQFQLAVTNEHNGLSQEQMGKIFDRFERLGQPDSEQGFGLGLALVKELCSDNGWLIQCSSTPGQVTFRLSIEHCEVTPQPQTPAARQVAALGLNKPPGSDKHKQSILIVEDNHELREFLAAVLSCDYQVIQAENGQAGLKQAIEHIPDLIISDLMMPHMDGLELVAQLAKHDNSCHIPTILLTARADEQSHTQGLALGAVDYITKPFEARQLLYKVKNTLTRQAALLRAQLQQTSEEGTEIIVSERDKHFIQRLNKLVEQHYPDCEFSVEALVSRIAMSERQLQRKFKALFNQTPAEYLRNYRLSQAKVLLKEGKAIALVADAVGFNSASYFSRSFKAAFGLSPRAFIGKASQ